MCLGHYDGITFDYESPIAATNAATMDLYLALVNETTQRFHAAIPGSQVSGTSTLLLVRVCCTGVGVCGVVP